MIFYPENSNPESYTKKIDFIFDMNVDISIDYINNKCDDITMTSNTMNLDPNKTFWFFN